MEHIVLGHQHTSCTRVGASTAGGHNPLQRETWGLQGGIILRHTRGGFNLQTIAVVSRVNERRSAPVVVVVQEHEKGEVAACTVVLAK